MAKNSNHDYWKQVISEQSISGMTQNQWCDQNNVNIHNFRYWKGRLLKKQVDTKEKSVVSQPKWALITESKDTRRNGTKADTISIHIGQVTIEVNDDFSSKTLSDVVAVLIKHV